MMFSKSILFSLIPALLSIACFGQPNCHPIIKIEEKYYYVSTLSDGRFLLPLAENIWNKWAAGTSFHTANLSDGDTISLIIEIADKKSFNCDSGIGFSCSIYRRRMETGSQINNQNRHCPVELLFQNGVVILIFPAHTDWESLSGSARHSTKRKLK